MGALAPFRYLVLKYLMISKPITEWYFLEMHSFGFLSYIIDIESYLIVSYRFCVSVQPSRPSLYEVARWKNGELTKWPKHGFTHQTWVIIFQIKNLRVEMTRQESSAFDVTLKRKFKNLEVFAASELRGRFQHEQTRAPCSLKK